MLPWLLMFQAGIGDASLAGVGFDLRNLPAERSADGAIVVTARRRDDREVMRAEQQLPEPLLPRAEFGLFGRSRIAVEAQQQALGGGVVSNRAMVTLKMPF